MKYTETVWISYNELLEIVAKYKPDEHPSVFAQLNDSDEGIPELQQSYIKGYYDHFNPAYSSLEVLRNGGVIYDDICYAHLSPELVEIIFKLAK